MAKDTRKTLVKSPDEFMSTIGRLIRWAKANKKKFIFTSLIVAIIIIGSLGFFYWETNRERLAMIEYFNAAGDIEAIEDLMQDYTHTKAGRLAILRLANKAYSDGDLDGAIKYAGEFIDAWGKKDIFYWESILILAQAYMDKGDLAGSIPVLDECISSGPGEIKDEALFYKGVVLKELNKTCDAIEVLEKVSGRYAHLARVYIGDID
ncbi:MAG: hypothetical protein J7L53_12985 [Deltaproteobacteria bacterium]|nr:hypothetical protein [Deltaproteobacteria bacterium]